MDVKSVERVLRATSAAFEMIGAGQMILARLMELQKSREASGKSITAEDVAGIMDAGDIEAGIQRAKLMEALAKQQA